MFIQFRTDFERYRPGKRAKSWVSMVAKDTTMEQIKALKRVAAEMKLSDRDVEDIMNNNAKRLIDETSVK